MSRKKEMLKNLKDFIAWRDTILPRLSIGNRDRWLKFKEDGTWNSFRRKEELLWFNYMVSEQEGYTSVTLSWETLSGRDSERRTVYRSTRYYFSGEIVRNLVKACLELKSNGITPKVSSLLLMATQSDPDLNDAKITYHLSPEGELVYIRLIRHGGIMKIEAGDPEKEFPIKP